MVDIYTVKYKVFFVDNKNVKYNITDFVHDLGWEENDREISMRLSFTARNDETAKGYLSTLIQPGCLVCVSAKDGNGKYKEVARGNVVDWGDTRKNSAHDLKCVCYDSLHNLQKSQDNFYFRSGIGTKSRIKQVLKKWKVPLGTYQGPDKKHGKEKYQNRYLSDILLSILDDAVKKGGKKCVIRMEKNKVSIVPRGSNKDIYVFKSSCTKESTSEKSMDNLVTRVKVIGTSNDDGKDSVCATLNGLIKYGIRQRIYTRGSDETTSQAKKAAQEILNENGTLEKKLTVQTLDIPYVRKGDMVFVKTGGVIGFYYVVGVQHNAQPLSMTMNLEPAEEVAVSKNKTKSSASYKVGDVVVFQGGKHYVSAVGKRSSDARAGKAKITKIKALAKHPYFLIHTNSKSDVYGWVDEGMFR